MLGSSLLFFFFDEAKLWELILEKFAEGIIEFLDERVIVEEELIKLRSENGVHFEDCYDHYKSENEFRDFRWNKVDNGIDEQMSNRDQHPMYDPSLLLCLWSRTANGFQCAEKRRCVEYYNFKDPNEEVQNHFAFLFIWREGQLFLVFNYRQRALTLKHLWFKIYFANWELERGILIHCFVRVIKYSWNKLIKYFFWYLFGL